jgi:Fe-S oxidoreductase
MTSNKIHPTFVTATSGEELGRQIMSMRYDEVLKVLSGMKLEATSQANGDYRRGYTLLSSALLDLFDSLKNAERDMANIVNICRPYIDKEIETQKQISACTNCGTCMNKCPK